MFRFQVQKVVKEKYKREQISKLLNNLSSNNLEHMDVGTVWAELSELNKHLVSPVIPFMKIVNLPKHTQKGIHGPVVSVNSDLKKVTTTFLMNRYASKDTISTKKYALKGFSKLLISSKKRNPHFAG